jgi:nicotinamide mononucleotide (NMN) deamidase PncC
LQAKSQVSSTSYAGIAATGETTPDVEKNGSNTGTVTFAAASATPVFALPSATSFAAGDRLGIVNEDPADATLAGVSLTFAGTRGS